MFDENFNFDKNFDLTKLLIFYQLYQYITESVTNWGVEIFMLKF